MITANRIDWLKLRLTVQTCAQFLDNVIEASNFPLPAVEQITRGGNRKIGLGVMGFADALIRLGIPYNSEQALEIAENIMKFIFEEARKTSAELADKRGVFPNYKGSIYDKTDRPKMRNATVVSIAPTGTISIIAGCSSGIEPLFGLAFVRNIMEGTRLLEVNPVFEQIARERGFFSPELMEKIARTGTVRDVPEIPEDVRRVLVTDWDIEPQWHVRMQAVFQKYSDNSVSKTVNLPSEATPDDVRKIYTMAYELKCKGITVYRYGSKKEQVLTLPGTITEKTDQGPFVTVDSEYAGGCSSCGRAW